MIKKRSWLTILAFWLACILILISCLETDVIAKKDTDNTTPLAPPLSPAPLLPPAPLGGDPCSQAEIITRYVVAGSDDCFRRLTTDAWNLIYVAQGAGAYSSTLYQYGGGMRFLNIVVPQGYEICSANITFKARRSYAGANCLTMFSAEDLDDAPTFVDNKNIFDDRWANRTTARIEWDNIGAWAQDSYYTSVDFKPVIQEIIDRVGWVSGNDIVIFWEDFEGRSPHATGNWRDACSYDEAPASAPKLEISFVAKAPETCPDNFILQDLGGNTANLTWNSVEGATEYEVRFLRNAFPQSVNEGELGYSGGSITCNITGLALEISKYGFSVWAKNDIGYSPCYISNYLGGEDMLDAVLMVLPLASALILVFISFFQKSILIKLAIICCMWAVFIQAEFQNTWLQSAAILIIIWAALTAFFRVKEKGAI